MVYPAGTVPPPNYGTSVPPVADDSFWVHPGLLRNADVIQITPYQDPPNSLLFMTYPSEPAIDPAVTRYHVKFAFLSVRAIPTNSKTSPPAPR